MRQVRSLKILLKDMESIVKNPKLLYNGRDFKNFSLRPREVWANWLLCAVYQNIHKDESITFAEDEECDGVLIDKLTGGSRKTEHVSALDVPLRKKGLPQGETRIIDAINLKINKGKEYAEGKILVVFFDGAGKWYRNKIREAINGRHNFCMIYCIGLLTSDNNGYAYSVTELHEKKSISFKVHINLEFTDWTISLI